MNGFFRNDGTWVQRELAGRNGNQQEALSAVAEAIERVQHQKSKAGTELRQLLGRYPLLRQEQKGKTQQSPLQLLAHYYAAETLGIGYQDEDKTDDTLQR
jgi:hypothetical protein